MSQQTPPRRWFQRAGAAARLAALLAVLAAAAVIIASRLLGYGTYVIYGSSMEPAIPVGSLVVAAPADPEGLEVGDVVVFNSPSNGVRVTHRIVDIVEQGDSRYIRTKGDASPGDDPLQLDARAGVRQVVFHVPYLGYLVNFAKSPLGILLLVVAPALALLALNLRGGRPAAGETEAAGEA
jgi:signal peptidase